MWDALAPLALAAVQVLLRELVDRLVQERGGAHRGLADGEVEDPARRHFIRDQLLERVLDDAPGEALRRVVAGRLYPVTPCEAVDEPALGMDLELSPSARARFEYPLVLAVLVQLADGHEPGVCQLVGVPSRLLHFVEVLLREETAVGEQRLVDRAELVDAELGVGDAAATPVPATRRTGEGHQADDLLEDFVAKLHRIQKRHRTLAEQGAVEGPDPERVVE